VTGGSVVEVVVVGLEGCGWACERGEWWPGESADEAVADEADGVEELHPASAAAAATTTTMRMRDPTNLLTT